jgi:hypothetical protein
MTEDAQSEVRREVAARLSPGAVPLLVRDPDLRIEQQRRLAQLNVENNDPDVDDPSVPRGFKALAFLAPGAPDKGRLFALEVMAKLPVGARAARGPSRPPRIAARASPFGGAGHGDRHRFVPINPHGKTHLGEVLFPAKSRAALRLLVQIPEESHEHTYQVSVRQLWERQEVGRVTWRLQPGQCKKRHLPD